MPDIAYVLYESASGYALFSVNENEEIALKSEEVQASINSFDRFGKVVKLKGFMPFKSAQSALENINDISDGIVHKDLENFLELNLPSKKSSKKSKAVLGVSDGRLGSAIQDAIDFPCKTGDVVQEITRGIRLYFSKFLKALKDGDMEKAQLGLGHSYSRGKVKFNVHRVDNMIIQSISLLDQLDKDVNTFAMRIREWYGYHFPELVKVVPDNVMYAKVVKLIKSRTKVMEGSDDDYLEELEDILMDTGKAKQVLDAAKSSMGMEISDIDLVNIDIFADRVISLAQYRQKLHEYLKSKMRAVAPSLSALVGELVGARLIAHAGSLTNLAKYPASTVQILGAEKALFRALKTKSNTPKYGLIFHSSFIGRAGVKNKGRISRYLANKCSIASRIDCFADTPTPVFGEKLREQVEERLGFYETGDAPRKNVDVMEEAMKELKEQTGMDVELEIADDGKKSKKRKAVDEDEDEAPAKKKKDSKKEKKDKKDKKSKKSKKEKKSKS
eukprot:Clim_evm46s199 gene=Clim_evmTU46s199